MLLTVLTAVMFSAAPGATLAAPTFSAANVKAEVVRFSSDHFSQQLGMQGLRVISASDISALLGLERQKQMLGCAEESCLAELSNALGADAVVLGALGQFGESIVVNVKVIAAGTGKQLAVFSGQAKEADLPAELTRAAKEIASQLLVRDAPAPVPWSPLRKWSLAPLGVGVGAVGVGAVLMGLSQSSRERTQSAATFADAVSANRQAESQATTGLVLTSVGAAVLVAGVVLFAAGADAPSATLSLVPGGASVSVQGRFP